MTDPTASYKERVSTLTQQLAALNKKKNLYGWLRFLSFVAAVGAAWLLWNEGAVIVGAAVLIIVGLFLFLLAKDLDNKDAIENLNRLLKINQTEIDALDHHFNHLPDGSHHKPETHDYANDLDIFGRASLFQYINRTTTQQGGLLLSHWLLSPAEKEKILQRQQAVKELASQTEWRQQLQSYGIEEGVTFSTQQKIENWLAEPGHFINKPIWKILRFLFPVMSCTALILHIVDIIPASIFYPLVLLFLVISLGISKMIMPAYIELNKIAPQLGSLSKSVNWIEKKEFRSSLLLQLKDKYQSPSGTSSQTIRRLKKILDMLDIRLNPLVFLPLNTFFFWDLQQAFALEKWKANNKNNISNWFDALAKMECLSSIATLSFNHPHWVFPAFSNDAGVFIAEKLGHPLLPKDKMVDSSFSTSGIGQLNLITGSNMAGKSTFLRSVGVNIVLAMMGGPVCAYSLTLSHMKVMSSMRVSDNLEESTSTFYAELKKLKEIIEAVNRNEKVFLLLDEILRGTNSADRHAGSKALIQQLIHHKAAGLIATHDLELAKLTNEFPDQIHNYHFDVQVANDELYFDYKLKRGVCQSMNASLLMKKIGIEL
ncbi:MAG: hypothetical protein HOP10_13340 [Chitinophagaceae bacterium]|nr:hypothetical protein [Chitinophagaceae bacterium]